MDQNYTSHPSGSTREEDHEYRPWYKDQSAPLPFQIARKISLNNANKVFQTLAMFPWDKYSLKKLWPNAKPQWRAEIISECSDAVAVGADFSLYIFFTRQHQSPICVALPADNQQLIRADKTCVAWAMVNGRDGQQEPVIIVSRGSLIYIYNFMQKGISGWIRGHGGAITSISVQPTSPHIFCTTSRDFTTRIYDLRLPAAYTPDNNAKGVPLVPNPHWPPSKKPSLAGAAHGLRLPPTEPEGVGHGRCIIVLMGGRSGGHEAAVLASAFHPSLPLIATAGMDRAIKIWAIRPTGNNHIKREDKPLFSSSRIHKARVLSVSWLQEDLLLTASAPAIMRRFPEDKKDKTTYVVPGELSIWKWFGLNRFFPPEHRNNPQILKGLRGISSDYQESSSFKIISTHSFEIQADLTQYMTPNLKLSQSDYHDPMVSIVYPGDRAACIFNAAGMSPRSIPPFPDAVEKLLQDPATNTDPLSQAAKKLNINRDDSQPPNEDRNREEGSDEEDDDHVDEVPEPRDNSLSQRPETSYPVIAGRLLYTDGAADSLARLMDCEMGMGGRMVVGVGTEGCVWVWTLVQP